MKKLTTYNQSLVKWKNLISNKVILLELCSGPKKGFNGWTTVDFNRGADVNWDLVDGIPLPDSSVSKIYSSHLLEHIPYIELIEFLKECKRILKPGGEFLVCVPNSGYFINAYFKGEFFEKRDKWYKPAIVDTYSCIDQINYIAYMDNHDKYMFDEENLINTLKKAGILNVKLRDFDEKIDRFERDYQSIYAFVSK